MSRTSTLLTSPFWLLVKFLMFPFYLFFFTSGRVVLPVLQNTTTAHVLVAAIVFFEVLWLVLFVANAVRMVKAAT